MKTQNNISEIKHTQGEWFVKNSEVWSKNPLEGPIEGIVKICKCDNTLGNADANAKLIAVAPDMLKMLKRFVAICEAEDQFPNHAEEAQELINKIESH